MIPNPENGQPGLGVQPAMGPAPFWSLKPAKHLHPNKRKQKPKPKRLGSLEAWRSDKILEAAHQRMSPKKTPPKLQIDPLSVVGQKPTVSSPLHSQLPGSRASPQSSPTGDKAGKSNSPGVSSPNGSQSPKTGSKRAGNAFPSPTGTPGSMRQKKEIMESPSSSNHSPIPAAPTYAMDVPEATTLGREQEVKPSGGRAAPAPLDVGVPAVALGGSIYGGKHKPSMPPPPPPVTTAQVLPLQPAVDPSVDPSKSGPAILLPVAHPSAPPHRSSPTAAVPVILNNKSAPAPTPIEPSCSTVPASSGVPSGAAEGAHSSSLRAAGPSMPTVETQQHGEKGIESEDRMAIPDSPAIHDVPRVGEGELMGRLMETEMTLRLKFHTGKELRRVQDKVSKGLDFLDELHRMSSQLGVIEGLIFQELLARLDLMSPATFSTATTPASPTLRAIRQENRALGGLASPPIGGPKVNRTPLPGQAHPSGGGLPAGKTGPPRPIQSKVETLGYDKQQALIRAVANLRGLVRIKIEDNGDLALVKKALQDARLVFTNVWAMACEMPVESVDAGLEESSWPPSPGDDPSLDRRVALVLEKLRAED